MFRLAASPSVRAPVLMGARRQLHQSPVARKNLKEQVEGVAHEVNMKLGRGMAAAIDKGEELTEAAKSTLGAASEKTKKEAGKAADAGQHKLNEAKSKTDKASKVGQQKFNRAATSGREMKEDFQKEMSK